MNGCTGTSRISVQEAFAAAARAQRAGQWASAVLAYQEVLALKPDLVEAHHNLGMALRALGRLDEAAAALRQGLEISPSQVETRVSLGLVLQELGQTEAAADCFQQAVAIQPDHPGARMNLGNVEHVRGHLDAAVAAYRQVLARHPGFPDAHMNLGGALRDQGDLAGAEASYRRALALRPDYAAALYGLGAVLGRQGRMDAAIATYERAIGFQPDLVEAHANLGAALQTLGRLEAAEGAYRTAATLRPDAPDAQMNLARALLGQGRLDEALACFERALALKPDLEEARDALLCGLSYRSAVSPQALLAEHRRSNMGYARPPSLAHGNGPDPARRLRIGYVSGDFHHHPVGFFIGPVLAAHDRSKVEVFAYSNGERADGTTARLRQAADHWREIAALSDETALARIREDRIDILVDLSGHTPANRLGVFAMRAAPVQASWLGYAATTGLASIDYLVMDPATAPAGAEVWCSEALARLPHGRFCYGPPDHAPTPGPAPSIAAGRITFGSFNNLAKVGPGVAELWARVLAATPGSRLVLKWAALDEAGVRRRIGAMFAAAGAPTEAIELRGFSPHAEMLAEYDDIDIALDPFPFCGGLTSCEALWMGVPVVTWPQDRFASRQTLGFLRNVGLEDLSAGSGDDYVAIAATLAGDVARRVRLRSGLRPRMAASPLCDAALFTPSLEAAFREMWRRWCAGDPPAVFEIRSAAE